MSYRTTNSAWKKLRPECVPDQDLDGFETDPDSASYRQKIVDDSTIVDYIVTIGQSMGLEVNADDIEERFRRPWYLPNYRRARTPSK